jgi:hypothetical protein
MPDSRLPTPDSPARSTRHEDWDLRLDAYLRNCTAKPFAWGEHDCCLFACDAVREMTGIDPAAEFRGRYSTRAEAYRLLRRETGKGDFLEAIGAISETCGFVSVPVPLARRGDAVAIRDAEDTTALGIVALDGMRVVVLAPTGLTYYPLVRAVAAWRI